MPIKNRIAEFHDEITGWRRALHAQPELMFDTHETARFVAEKLRDFGCDEVVTGIGRTGVVGVIRGQSEGRTIGLRADMDALPIEEATGLDYASQTPGKMHACGHDGHTSMLLGAAKYLAETRRFSGTCVVIFQPAEEGGGGGREMVEDGLMERFSIDEVYGMHNWPGLPVGEFAIRPGGFFAAADQFDLVIEGKGGHAAKPHEGVDPTLVAAHVMTALQSVASRNVDPVHHVVVSVTTLATEGDSYNVIPQRVHMKGTIRTHDPAVREHAPARIEALARGIAQGFGAEARFAYHEGYPVMVNAQAETEFAAQAAQRVTGQPTADHDPIMGGEDFAYMLEARPGAYILVGNGDTAPVHHPEYDFNDGAIPAGASWWVELVEMRQPLE